MGRLCFDPDKDECTTEEEDQCLKPELRLISNKKTNFTVVLLEVVCQITDFCPSPSSGDCRRRIPEAPLSSRVMFV